MAEPTSGPRFRRRKIPFSFTANAIARGAGMEMRLQFPNEVAPHEYTNLLERQPKFRPDETDLMHAERQDNRLARKHADASEDNAQIQAAGLVRTIEGELIPRLMMALRDPAAEGVTPSISTQPSDHHITELTDLVMSRSEPDLESYVKRLCAHGMSLDMIYLQLIAQVANRLGEMWKEDTADFAEVTVALGRLHRIVRHLSPAFRAGNVSFARWPGEPTAPRRILVTPMPGEQHTLGCAIVEEFFAKAGWEVISFRQSDDTLLVDLLANDYVDVVGLSVSCDSRLRLIEKQIAAMRAASQNRQLVILVGGRIFTDTPALAQVVGADVTAATADLAVAAAETAVKLQTGMAQ